MYINKHTHTHTYIHTYINTHTYIHTYINTHTHTHTHSSVAKDNPLYVDPATVEEEVDAGAQAASQ